MFRKKNVFVWLDADFLDLKNIDLKNEKQKKREIIKKTKNGQNGKLSLNITSKYRFLINGEYLRYAII